MDVSEIRRRSHAVWSAMATGWDARHAYFEQTARPVTEAMLARASLGEGDVVVDLAAGTGVVGLAAATQVGPQGRVIVSDFAPAMVEVAQRNAEALGLDNVDCRVLDAEQLALDDASVDVVLCRWGYMLMPDPAAALAESRRVLRPGGRLSAAVFAGPQDNLWAALPMQVLVERGLVEPPQPDAPGILALADQQRLGDLLTQAGFDDIAIEDVAFSWPFADGEEYWRFLNEAAGAIADILEGLEPDMRTEVRQDLLARLDPYETADGLEFPALCVVVSATIS